ncbi:MAG: hypothetical protein AAF871_11115 [Pseudomonadota bacterium]
MRRLAILLTILATPAAAEPALSVTAEHQGFREYYCVTKGTLTNTGTDPIREVNGFFRIFKAGVEVGHSKGTSFLGLAPGESMEALFEAPNVPCDTADEYHFIVSTCMEGTSFINRALCAENIAGSGTVTAVAPR